MELYCILDFIYRILIYKIIPYIENAPLELVFSKKKIEFGPLQFSANSPNLGPISCAG